MTADEITEVTRLIELATEAGKARQKELFRCVDVLVERAKRAANEADSDIADALFDAAKAILAN